MTPLTHKILIVFILAFFCQSILANPSDQLALAQKVLDKLYTVSGQYIYEKPSLELDKENQRVAAYLPSKNLITIDEKVLSICNSLGAESENALAFIIGHELAHAFQKEVRHGGETTNFLSYDKHIHSSIRTEKVADIQGVFTGYLADYGMKKAIPEVLEKIYKEYNLTGKKLPNYPTFEERSNSANEVVALVENLKDLFELTPYLLALEENVLAINSLEYILEYYQGFEIQNNIGVAYLYSVLDLTPNEETDRYSYPIEIENSSQLRQIDITRGPLNHMEKIFRDKTLKKSMEYFDDAINHNRKYTIAKINKACALNLSNQPEQAIEYLNSSIFSANEKKSPKYKMVFAISEGLLKRTDRAAVLFNSIKENNNLLLSSIANYNYQVLKGKKTENYSQNSLEIPDRIIQQADQLKLGRTRDWETFILSGNEEAVFFKKKKTALSKSYSYGDEINNYFSIVILANNKKNHPSFNDAISNQSFHNVVMVKNSIFVKSEKGDVIIKLDEKGNVLEIARFY